MSSDRARRTFNPPQRYRSVVMQQGRVQLEADWNEAQDIFGEELRADVLDIVGPYGTPDDGYKVSFDPGKNKVGDFTIGKGTMYVGGIRHELFKDLTYMGQKEFDWVNGPVPESSNGIDHVSLYIREQEVSAVEDGDLKEVALGGPDTGQRKRHLQRVLCTSVKASDCEKAWDEVLQTLSKKGYGFNPETMRLVSNNRLQVGFVASLVTPDPCEPAAHGGYLGADNQLIQVKVVSYDANKKTVRFVWGFDNASHLFKVVVQPDQKTLILNQQPVDTFHWPRANQAVELLQSAAKLSNGQFMAENLGFVSAIAADYNVDDQSVVLLNAAPAAAYPANQTNPPIYLRLWEEVVEVEVGKAAVLGHTGLQITITQEVATKPLSVGDYWSFAVRPSTPQTVCPARYLNAAQPPEGPRQWLAPLAVLTWGTRQEPDIDDCREVFEDLVTLTKRKSSGCCSVVVTPEDAPRLQEIIDRFKSKDAQTRQVNICFQPGVYVLPKALRLGPDHSNITLEACHGGVVFQADPKNLAEFLQGMVILLSAEKITVAGIAFQLPLAAYKDIKDVPKDFDIDWIKKAFKDISEKLILSIGIRTLACNELRLSDCQFLYSLPADTDIAAIGLFLGSDCGGLRVHNCTFTQTDSKLMIAPGVRPLRMLIGMMLMPVVNRSNVPGAAAPAEGSVIPTFLYDAVIKGNEFVGLTIGALLYAVFGTVRITNNSVLDCYQGFTMLSIYALLARQGIGGATVGEGSLNNARGLAQKFMRSAEDPVTVTAMSLMRSYPVPGDFDMKKAIKVSGDNLEKEPEIDMKVIQPLIDSSMKAFVETPPVAPPTGGTIAGVRPTISIGTLLRPTVTLRAARDLTTNFKTAESKIGTIERQALAKLDPKGLIPYFYIAGNHFVTMIPETKSSSHSMNITAGAQPPGSAVVMEGNYFQNNSTDATVEVTAFETTTMTGNQFYNEMHSGDNTQDRRSLEVFPAGEMWMFTATGNSFLAYSNIFEIMRFYEGFKVGDPFVTWRFANTMRM